jgi:hypothetical protein
MMVMVMVIIYGDNNGGDNNGDDNPWPGSNACTPPP